MGFFFRHQEILWKTWGQKVASKTGWSKSPWGCPGRATKWRPMQSRCVQSENRLSFDTRARGPQTSGLHQSWCNIYSADVYEILGRQLGHSNSFLQNKAVKVEAPRCQPHNQPKKCSRAKYMEWMVMTYAISGTDFSASPAIDAPKKSIRNWASSLGEARRHHIAGARGWVWTPNKSHDCWVQ